MVNDTVTLYKPLTDFLMNFPVLTHIRSHEWETAKLHLHPRIITLNMILKHECTHRIEK